MRVLSGQCGRAAASQGQALTEAPSKALWRHKVDRVERSAEPCRAVGRDGGLACIAQLWADVLAFCAVGMGLYVMAAWAPLGCAQLRTCGAGPRKDSLSVIGVEFPDIQVA